MISLSYQRPVLRLVVLLCVLALPLVIGAAAAGPAAAAGGEEQSSGRGENTWLDTVCAVSADEAWTGGAPPSVLLHTIDGGANWYGVYVPISGDLLSIAFIGQSGWVSAYDYGSKHLYNVHTTDAGQTWADRPAATDAGSVDRFLPTGPDTCWGWRDLGNSAPKSQLLSTTDGGVTWTGNAAWTTKGYNQPQAGSFLNAQTGWFVDSFTSKVYRTTDGGGSWAESSPAPPGYASYLANIDFVSATTGWVAGGDGFVTRTTDGGQTWAPVASIPVRELDSIDFASAAVGWATGTNGTHDTIWHTTDGGVTWGAQLYTTTKILLDLAAGDSTHAWLTGTQGLIVHTGDGGGPLDTTGPTATAAGPTKWVGAPANVTITVDDGAGLGAWKAEWKWDAVVDWTGAWAPADVTVETPADHSRDGLHTLTYRGVDWANNRGADQTIDVGVDTQKPAAKAPSAASVRRLRSVSLKYKIVDVAPNGGHGDAQIAIKNRAGKVVKKSAWINSKAVGTVFSWRFTCKLRKGTYRFYVSVRDEAGNSAARKASNRLTVK